MNKLAFGLHSLRRERIMKRTSTLKSRIVASILTLAMAGTVLWTNDSHLALAQVALNPTVHRANQPPASYPVTRQQNSASANRVATPVSHHRRRSHRGAIIGGSAAGGALIGGLAGGGRGLVLGGALGAGGGYLYSRYRRHHHSHYHHHH